MAHTVDQKPAATTQRHVDRIGELMEADDDDDEMTSDSCPRSLDKHDPHDDVGGPCGVAGSPRADDGASCVQRCHGDDDESDELQISTVEESLLSQLPQQQQPATGGYSSSHNFLCSLSCRVSAYVSVRLCVCLWMPMQWQLGINDTCYS